MIAPVDIPLQRQRIAQLFKYLSAYLDLRFPPIREMEKQRFHYWLRDLPKHDSIQLAGSDDGSDEGSIILSIKRATLSPCPLPSDKLLEWLVPGWKEHGNTAEVRTTRNVLDSDGITEIERFDEDPQLVAAFKSWKTRRELWQTNEKPASDSLKLFQKIYEWYGVLGREGERIELLVGDGVMRCKDYAGDFRHPVLFQKVELEFFPDRNPPAFEVRLLDRPPELYLEFLRALPAVNIEQLAKCASELGSAEFGPLSGNDTAGFLRRLVQGIFPNTGVFLDSPSAGPAPSGPTMERGPALFMRSRRAGLSAMFQAVIDDVASCEMISPALVQILGLVGNSGPMESDPEDEVEIGNEDEDVLFGKPANSEQLKIARQIERKECVLVQGPPGTGKTHTIANLLGHLLSQGKRVLVTAHTPKALKVLREKVVGPLQPLCVSVLQNDKKSQEELQASVTQISLRLSEDLQTLSREAEKLAAERDQVIKSLRQTRSELLAARQSEIQEVVFGGNAIYPVEAAKFIKKHAEASGWIPGPVSPGSGLPLSPADIAYVYQSNALIPAGDERELLCRRPDLAKMPTPGVYEKVLNDLESLNDVDLTLGEDFWDGTVECDADSFDALLATAQKTIAYLKSAAEWEMLSMQAGIDGSEARRMWESLAKQIEDVWKEVVECDVVVAEMGPSLEDPREAYEQLSILDSIIAHSEAGGSFGMLSKLMNRPWFELADRVMIGKRKLEIARVDHLRAARSLVRARQLREELIERWGRQMSARGGLAISELGQKPESTCKQYVSRIRTALNWHEESWAPFEERFENIGFKWVEFLDAAPPVSGDNAELRRMQQAVVNDLGPILQARAGRLRQREILATLESWLQIAGPSKAGEAVATGQLRAAIRESSPTDYRKVHATLVRLNSLEGDLRKRQEMLKEVARTAPGWATAIETRVPGHDGATAPGGPEAAWKWRQYYEELERRAAVSLDELQQAIERDGRRLLELTSKLIEKRTWACQIRQTSTEQKRALGAYAVIRSKITKSGRGVRDAEMRAQSRKEMETAKDAVPVWIMPLLEVADNFDPRKTRFDVVIIDEASQCDPASLFALYLGERAIVVGDDEQVTPSAVGMDGEEVSKLIKTMLDGVPNNVVFSGDTSVYDLARIAFGGVIRLTEHFRCAPNIIAFSNDLAYNGEIKPLREASTVPFKQHVVHHRVNSGFDNGREVNEPEALAVASLICAASKIPEYDKNDEGKPTSFGVVSLVGSQQALRIDTLLRLYMPPTDYVRRKVLCGDSAQFQGDERDVMFLSVVDQPPANPPLYLRQEGAKKMFKKRYNVAASRARNQMWVVNSLNRETDLKPTDYRRRIIEHALDPEAWERQLRAELNKVDPNSKAFEGVVLRRLMDRGFRVVPQHPVGAYRIDLVVVGSSGKLAVECDGEKYHGHDKLEEDIGRQAVLERLGWRFVRIRGSVFFRDEERALEPVLARLAELNIEPNGHSPELEAKESSELTERVIREAEKLRREWGVVDFAPPPILGVPVAQEAHLASVEVRVPVNVVEPLEQPLDRRILESGSPASLDLSAKAPVFKLEPDLQTPLQAELELRRSTRETIGTVDQLQTEIVFTLRERGRCDTEPLLMDIAKRLQLKEDGKRNLKAALTALEIRGVVTCGANYVVLV